MYQLPFYNEIANWTEIAGFLMTIATLIYAFAIERKISKFEKKVLFNTRVPSLLEQLKINTTILRKCLGHPMERKVKEILTLCLVVIEDLKLKLPDELQQDVKILRKVFRKQCKARNFLERAAPPRKFFQSKKVTGDDIWETFRRLSSLSSNF